MYCCVECFSDEKIKEFIIDDYGEKGECDYCYSENVNIATVDDVGSFIMAGINRAYEDPANQVGFESKEGGYLLPTTDLYDLLIDELELFSEKLDDPHKLLNDLVSDPLAPYVEKDPYGPPRGYSDESYHWGIFCKLVKTKRRFTAFLPDEKLNYSDTPHPIELMKTIVTDLAVEHFHTIKAGKKIYRARLKRSGTAYEHKDLTSPPANIARNNRMSPAGISLFYGARDTETCISELRPGVGELIVVGEFVAKKDLLILDLSGIPVEVPSIFSDLYSHRLERWISFINDFKADISKPIRSMDREIDYIPTQIFTEYLINFDFRDVYYAGEDQQGPLYINGLQFNSSLHEDGINIVLFRGPEVSIQTNPETETLLSYQGSEIYNVDKVAVYAEVAQDGVVSKRGNAS